jgi:hypothetical protein
LGQEVGVAREVGAHHGLAQQHALGRRAAEALGAVQRHIGIAGVDQAKHHLAVERQLIAAVAQQHIVVAMQAM